MCLGWRQPGQPASGPRRGEEGGVPAPSQLGRTGNMVLAGTFCSSGLPALSPPPASSHPTRPAPPRSGCLWRALPESLCLETQVLGWSVCVSGLSLSPADSRPGCGSKAGGGEGAGSTWRNVTEAAGPRLPALVTEGRFHLGAESCISVCVPGSHTCSRGLCLWAPVGHVSWPSAGQEGLHMCVNVCPVRGMHTQAHTHTGVVCKCLSCVLRELCALELCMWVGTSGHWTWAGRKRRS